MKRWDYTCRLIAGVFLWLLTGTITALAQSASQRSYTFDEVIPELKTMKSGFNTAADIPGQYRYRCFTLGSKKVFTGSYISVTDIIKELGQSNVYTNNGPAFYRDNFMPVVKYLEVDADSFAVNDNLWIPECNIEIHADHIIVSKENPVIKTKPLPWQKTQKKELINPNEANAQNGLSGADVTITAATINQPLTIDVSGADGEPVYTPEIKITWPAYAPDDMEVHQCQGSGKQGSYSNRHKIANGHKIMYMRWFNYNDKGWGGNMEECFGNQVWDNSVRVDGTTVIDEKKNSRIQVGASVWGKGGNGGNVYTNLGSKINVINTGGATGYYIPREQNDVTYKKDDRGRVTDIDITRRRYCYHSTETQSGTFGKITISNNKEFSSFDVPYNEEYNAFVNKYKLKYGQEEGKPGKKIQVLHTLSPDYMEFAVNRLVASVKNYAAADTAVQKQLDARYTQLSQKLDETEKTAFRDNAADTLLIRRKLLAVRNQLDMVAHYKNADYDLYNNPLGYRPILSLQNAMTAMQQNIATDLRLFVAGSIMNSRQDSGRAVLASLDAVENSLVKQSLQLNDMLDQNLAAYNTIRTSAGLVADSLDALNKRIKAEAERLQEIAAADAAKRKKWAIGLRTVAIATSVIATAYGQPAVGAAGYSLINSVAKGVESNTRIDYLAVNTLKEFDFKGVVQGYKDGKLMRIEAAKRDKTVEGFDKKFRDADAVLKPVYKDSLSEAKSQRRNAFLAGFLVETGKMKEYYAYMKDMSVSTTYLNQQLDELKNNSPELRNLVTAAQAQVERQAALCEQLKENMQGRIAILGNIAANAEQRYAVAEIRLDPSRLYQPHIKTQFENMQFAALDRLRWYEYQLVKTYEYTTLQTYDYKGGTDFNNLLDNYKNDKNASVDLIVEKLKTTYDARLQDIKHAILNYSITSHKQDKNTAGYGRSIVLNAQSNKSILDQLNTTRKAEIDLQADLNDEIIKPDQANIRITDIALQGDKFKLEKLLASEGDRIEIKLSLDDKSVLRKGADLYKIDDNSGQGKEQPRDIWTWTLQRERNKIVIRNQSEPSAGYTGVMKASLGDANSSSALFTYHPAWTKMYVEIKPVTVSNEPMPKIDNLEFIVKCDYEQNDLAYKGKSILDLRLNKAPQGTLIRITDSKGHAEWINTNRYSIIDRNTALKLEARSPADAPMVFSHWVVSGMDIAPEKLKNPMLELSVTDDVRIYPVYAEKTL